MFKEPPVILFADRDLTSTRPLRCELRRRGAQVLMASSLNEALRNAELFHPDLFVLDDGLRGPEVKDLVLYFRSVFPRSEIILLTADSSGMPWGLGLGLLYSGGRQVANQTLLEIVLSAYPGRLVQSDPKECLLGTVLCVDDDRCYLNSLVRLLRRHGYRVSTFQDGKDALAAIPEVAPDLALLDVLMPGMSGLHLAREIRTGYGPLIPIVLLSAKTSSADQAAGYLHGASRYVAKSGDPRRLLDVVDYYAGDLDSQEREILEAQL